MIQKLKINITHDKNIRIMAWVNGITVPITSAIDLDLTVDNVVEIKQDPSVKNDFFYIDSVYLGNLNITNLLHFCGICQVVDLDGNKIANFIPDIGSTDKVIITVNRDFYFNVVQHIDLVKIQEPL
jgi:hypothetical protein